MRILRLYPFLPPLPGGMEKHVASLSREQRFLGHDVSVVFNQGKATSDDDHQVMPWVNLRKLRPQFVRDLIYSLSVLVFLVRRRKRYDLVHVHGDWSAFLFSFPLTIVSFSLRRAASVHGRIRQGRVWRIVYFVALRRFDFVYATGRNEARILSDYTGKDVRWRSSGVSDVFFSSSASDSSDESIDVISVSNFFPVKNQKLVIEVAFLLPQYRFFLVGDGPERAPLQDECIKRGISNVVFSGSLSQLEVAESLARAKVFLITSYSEGTPTAMIEAMASGLAIVSSASNDYGSLVVDGIGGYVVNGFSPVDFADRLVSIISDEDLRRRMNLVNREAAKGYTWNSVAREITNWFTGSKA